MQFPILWRPGDGPFPFARPARPVRRIFWHCSASDRPEHDAAEVMHRWHLEKGWSGIGYHLFVRKDGTVEAGRDLEVTPSAQADHNTGSIAICLHGLVPERFTAEQFHAARAVAAGLHAAYGDAVTHHGHCEVAPKSCPVFDYRAVLGLDAAGRYRNGAGTAPETAVDHAPPPHTKGRTMALLDRGEDVRRLQIALTARGHDAGAADGVFGQVTRLAVVAFQRASDLTADGVAGPKTLSALRMEA